jgi:hypothetical protein
MQRLIIPIIFITFNQLTSAQVSDQDILRSARDQVIPDDLIVQGSECVGMDCVNNENFGFSTIILKENNLRIKFLDTSTGTFPSNDWTLEANSSANGGTNHFAIVDDDGGRVPFKIIAGAPTNSLFVASNGNLGLGTDNPVYDIHAKGGNTPTLRLEQDGSSGFTPQTWDIAGNEANFFVRDVTRGSLLPFRIRPGAPTSSIDISASGNVGIGTASPALTVHMLRTDASETGLRMENTNTTAQPIVIQMVSKANGDQNWNIQNNTDGAFEIRNATSNNTMLLFDPTSNLTIIPGDLTVTGVFTVSDRRLKSDLSAFNDGLEVVKRMNPVSYRLSDRVDFNSDRMHYGILAQDLQEIAPYFVSPSIHRIHDDSGLLIRTEEYLKIDDSAIKWLLVNAIKDQQKIIDEKIIIISDLQAKVEELSSLKDKVNELSEQVEVLTDLMKSRSNQSLLLKGADSPFLGQNVANP